MHLLWRQQLPKSDLVSTDVTVKRLSLENTTVVALPPFKNYISYSVWPNIDIHTLGEMLYQELKAKRTSFLNTKLYARYWQFECVHGTQGDQRWQNPLLALTCLAIAYLMFYRALTEGKKVEVLSMFGRNNTTLRLVIATTAFGMGVDIEDVRRIVHWGTPPTLEEYLQEVWQRWGGLSSNTLPLKTYGLMLLLQ